MKAKKIIIFIVFFLIFTIAIPEVLVRTLSSEGFVYVVESLNFLSTSTLVAILYEAPLISLVLSYLVLKVYSVFCGVRSNDS